MHYAPAVSYPVGRSRFQALLIVGVSFIGFVTLLAWTWQTAQTFAQQFGAWLLWLLSFAYAAIGWWRSPLGKLQFKNGEWNWIGKAGTQPVKTVVTLDFQHTLLLAARGSQTSTRWLWLEQRCQPQCWITLRRAAYAAIREPDTKGNPELPI